MNTVIDRPDHLSQLAWDAIRHLWTPANTDAFEFGPAHIVFSDPNPEDHSIDWCLENFDDPQYRHANCSPEDYEPVRTALRLLQAIPEDLRIDADHQREREWIEMFNQGRAKWSQENGWELGPHDPIPPNSVWFIGVDGPGEPLQFLNTEHTKAELKRL